MKSHLTEVEADRPARRASLGVQSHHCGSAMSGPSVPDCSWSTACATWRFSISLSIASCAAAISSLRVDDVAPNGYAIDRANVRQSKTGRPVRFELTEVTRQALDDYLRMTGRKLGQCLFQGRGGPDRHLTTRQYARLVGEWVSGIGLGPLKYATHSMRRTKATLIYRRTGNLRAVQLLLGHTKIESTVRYLGVEIDDALDIAEKVDV
jgi:integrase